MARLNRKKGKSAGYIVPVPFAIVVVVSSVLSLGYLWLGVQCDGLGSEIKELESKRYEAERKRRYEESRWAATKSPGEIRKALDKWGLNLAWPTSDQIVKIHVSEIDAAIGVEGETDAISLRGEQSASQVHAVERVAMND
jgi:hypothetical protein